MAFYPPKIIRELMLKEEKLTELEKQCWDMYYDSAINRPKKKGVLSFLEMPQGYYDWKFKQGIYKKD